MKISYHKKWDYKDGYVYNQGVSIDKEQLNILQLAIEVEIALNYPRKKEYVFDLGRTFFLKNLNIINNSIVFLNHTQTRFINLFLKLNLKDRNTYLLIK